MNNVKWMLSQYLQKTAPATHNGMASQKKIIINYSDSVWMIDNECSFKEDTSFEKIKSTIYIHIYIYIYIYIYIQYIYIYINIYIYIYCCLHKWSKSIFNFSLFLTMSQSWIAVYFEIMIIWLSIFFGNLPLSLTKLCFCAEIFWVYLWRKCNSASL